MRVNRWSGTGFMCMVDSSFVFECKHDLFFIIHIFLRIHVIFALCPRWALSYIHVLSVSVSDVLGRELLSGRRARTFFTEDSNVAF